MTQSPSSRVTSFSNRGESRASIGLKQTAQSENVLTCVPWMAVAKAVESVVAAPFAYVAQALQRVPRAAQTADVRKAVLKQCPVLLDDAVRQLKNALLCQSAGPVPSTAVNKSIRVGLTREIGRAAAANNVALLQIFKRHGFSQRTWMGPWVMECAVSYGSMAAVMYMVSEAGALKGDALLCLQRWPLAAQTESHADTFDFDFELLRFTASRVDKSLFCIA